jgi:type I restriction enzyme R subunit
MNWELDEVECPFIEQLVAMGWHYVEGNLDHPERTGRTSFAEVMQEAMLRCQIHALNLRDVAGAQVISHK